MAAIFEAGAEDAEALRGLARDDSEARVRRAAVSRLGDVELLAEVAKTDPDDDVKGEAVRALAGIAAETNDVELARAAFQHLVGLGRSKEVVVAVAASTHERVRAVAVEALRDAKVLGSVARHAPDGATRLLALGRLTDAEEILAVALRSEHTDVSIAALERLGSPDAIGEVSQRARNKVAARRAKGKARGADVASKEGRPPEPVADRLAPEERERAEQVLASIDAVVFLSNLDEATTALSAARIAWAELQADVQLADEWAPRVETAVDAAREAIAERQREHDAELARTAELAREQADRLAIVTEIEGLSGPSALDRIAELRVKWDHLPHMPPEYAASLTRRFQDASRGFEDRERRRALAEAAAGRLETLAAELGQLVASDAAADEAVLRWRGLRRDVEILREHAASNPEAARRVDEAVAVLEEREHEYQEARAKQEQDALRRLQQLCRQVDMLLGSHTVSLKAADRALRDVRAALEARHTLPSRKDRQEIHTRLEAARDALMPKVQELRDADEWQRWANLQVQEELCREMEALVQETDLDVAASRMRALQVRWKPVALAPRAQGEATWRRFKTAQDQVYTKASAHLAAQNEARAANLLKKKTLLERAESLATSNDWVKTAAEMQALQTAWKGIGPVTRGHEKAVWERFRAACDQFFTRRQEDLKRRRDEWAANLARKEELCAAAEALSASVEWEKAAAEFKGLQATWKTIGPVRKSKSDLVWNRFRAACDAFFERYKHRGDLELQAKASAREAIIGRVEALLPTDGVATEPPADLSATLQQIRLDWQKGPELPRGLQQDLGARFQHAVARVVAMWPAALAGTELDPQATQRRMEKLVARIEELASAQPRRDVVLSPAELLAQQWRDRLAANTIRGAKAEENDEARWRAVEQEIKSVQAQWARLGPVPPDVAGPLNERFQRACRRLQESRRRAS